MADDEYVLMDEGAWNAWSPRLTDLTKPTPTYYEAFEAGFRAGVGAIQGDEK